MIWYAWRCTRDHKGFEDVVGSGWEDQIPPPQAKHMVKMRWSPFLKMKASPEATWERDIPFWTIPDTDQQLLCDLWRPANGNVSGLAFIYLHGSAWTIGDKDLLTRPVFRHLASQGHTVMDVAYRLIPEVDIYGMVGDAKRETAWMKANADRWGVDPERIVTHVHPGCPPTLLIHGQQDSITPVDATFELYGRLVESDVPAINVVFPWTDHAFDMLLPQTSPPIQSALYDVDRFLALLANEGAL